MSSNKPTGSSAEPTAEKVPPSPPAMKKRRKYFFGVPETPMAPRQVTMNFINNIANDDLNGEKRCIENSVRENMLGSRIVVCEGNDSTTFPRT